MGQKGLFLFIAAVVLSWGCAPKGKTRASLLGTTGYTQADGRQFVTNGDKRVEAALAEEEQATTNSKVKIPENPSKTDAPKEDQVTPAAEPKTSPGVKPFSELPSEFEISRFHTHQDTPSRFGEDRIILKVIFNDGRPSAEFKAPLTGTKPNFKVNVAAHGFVLTGSLDDSQDETEGEFLLTENSTQQTARIFYWAYKAKLTVREDRTNPVPSNSSVGKQLTNLRENSFGWVNNWNVLRGHSFFLVDILKITTAESNSRNSLLSFKGPSYRTGDEVFDMQNVGGATSTVQLVGNAEEEAGRMFQVNIQDPETNQTHEFMLDVELIEPIAQRRAHQSPDALPARTLPEVQPEEPEPLLETSGRPPSKPDRSPPQPSESQLDSSRSFLRVQRSLPRTNRMIEDFNRNRSLTGVEDWIKIYTETTERKALMNFYLKANPFRRIMEKVGEVFDVLPSYAYLTVIESAYFKGGEYKIERGTGSTALGPFQLTSGTAERVGLSYGGAGDERRYFIPSACGAARYMRDLVNMFDFEDGDTTVAILAYNQGEGGAAAAIYCSLSDEAAGNRKACANRINNKKNNFSSKDYGKFLRLTQRYRYSFAKLDQKAAISEAMREYVHRKLAIYFISNDFRKYGFTLNGAEKRLPTNGTVMPASGHIKDEECEGATKGLY